MKIKDIKITNHKNLCFVPFLFIVGYLVASFMDNWPLNWLATWACGLSGLYAVYGWPQTKQLFQPMRKPYLKKLVCLYLLMMIAVGVVTSFMSSGLGMKAEQHVLLESDPESFSFATFAGLITYLENLVSATGEEALMASVILPIYSGLKSKKLGIGVTLLVGSVLFGLMHVFVYDFNLVSCIAVAIMRLFLTLAWFKTDSLRGGIYLHLFQDGLVIGLTMLLNTFM